MVDFKSVDARGNSKFEAARQEMVRVFQRYGDDLTPVEQLAIAAYFVGQIMALQDASKFTPETCFELILKNIEAGNSDTVAAHYAGKI